MALYNIQFLIETTAKINEDALIIAAESVLVQAGIAARKQFAESGEKNPLGAVRGVFGRKVRG